MVVYQALFCALSFRYDKGKGKENMKHRILILEDDPDMREALEYALSDFDCLFCSTLAQGFKEWTRGWDLIILDLSLPDGNGLELLQVVRLESDVPVLVFSGRKEESVILDAYAQKGDDYITKPVRLPVLKAKISRMLDRTEIRRFEGYSLEVSKNALSGLCPVQLTRTETAVLEPLFGSGYHAVSAERIIRSVWTRTGHDMSLKTLSVRLSGLRKKLKPAGLAVLGSRVHGYWLQRTEDEDASG
ncbi:response regulator transcription factor [Faecalibaculum rodentium]|uniref:response regulator transcription factor n=1 Tax=Faecalibaculum rodentium TaxID=1702221 RepID=UPI0025ADA546|nr:response regulator transcription factor [Faecalibaculum rodentium]